MNRVERRDDIGAANLEKLFNCPVHASLPNDYFSLHRVVTLGQPLGPEGELGKAIEKLAVGLCGTFDEGKSRGRGARTEAGGWPIARLKPPEFESRKCQ